MATFVIGYILRIITMAVLAVSDQKRTIILCCVKE